MGRKLGDSEAWEDHLQAYTWTIRFRPPQVQRRVPSWKQCDCSSQNGENRTAELPSLNRRRRLSELPLWRGSAVGATHLALLSRIWGAKGDHMRNTTRNGPEDPARIVGISQTGSTIPHQYKITPTIFPRKPILNRGRRLRRWHRRDRGRRHLVTDSQVPNWRLRILKTWRGEPALPPGACRVGHTSLSSRVRSRPVLTGAGKTRGRPLSQEQTSVMAGAGKTCLLDSPKNRMRRATHSWRTPHGLVALDRLNWNKQTNKTNKQTSSLLI